MGERYRICGAGRAILELIGESMTKDEIVTVTQKALAEAEPTFKGQMVGEVEPYHRNAVKLDHTFIGSFDTIDEKQLRDEISRALMKLQADGKHGFKMSEPDFTNFFMVRQCGNDSVWKSESYPCE
jgi:hypothetical protein